MRVEDIIKGAAIALVAIMFGFVCSEIGKISLGSDIHKYGCEKVMAIRDGK